MNREVVMGRKEIEETVEKIAVPLVKSRKLELVDIEFVKEGPEWYLRVYIDKSGGIVIDDCQEVSRVLSEKLDETDPISQSYNLEVSSPGLERPLKKEKDFKRYKGERVEVRLFKALNESKVFEGELLGLYGNKIMIKRDEEILEFTKDNVAVVKRKLQI